MGSPFACMCASLRVAQSEGAPSGCQPTAAFMLSMLMSASAIPRLYRPFSHLRLFEIAVGAHSFVPASWFGIVFGALCRAPDPGTFLPPRARVPPGTLGGAPSRQVSVTRVWVTGD